MRACSLEPGSAGGECEIPSGRLRSGPHLRYTHAELPIRLDPRSPGLPPAFPPRAGREDDGATYLTLLAPEWEQLFYDKVAGMLKKL